MNASEFQAIAEEYSAQKTLLNDRYRHAIYRRLFDFAENELGFVGVHTLELEFDQLSSDWFSVNLSKAIMSDGSTRYIESEDQDKEDAMSDAFSGIAYDLAEEHLVGGRAKLSLARVDGTIVATQNTWSERIVL